MYALIHRLSVNNINPTSDQIRQICTKLIQHHGIHPNMPVFGETKEPLLHVLAHRRKLGMMRELCQQMGADVEQTNMMGETPLAIALIKAMPFKSDQQLRSILEKVGGQLNAPRTVALLATYCVSKDLFIDLIRLHCAGLVVDPKQVPLMHLCAANCTNTYAGMFLLDNMDQDPLERDAEGRTILDLPEEEDLDKTWCFDLRSQVRDAVQNSPEHDLAVMMVVHKRLGKDSLLQTIPPELFSAFILPNATRHRKISQVRAERLQALVDKEGVTINESLEFQYTHMGSSKVMLHDFRRVHFLELTSGLCSNMSRDLLEERLTESGFLFDEPYTEDYAARAKANLFPT